MRDSDKFAITLSKEKILAKYQEIIPNTQSEKNTKEGITQRETEAIVEVSFPR